MTSNTHTDRHIKKGTNLTIGPLFEYGFNVNIKYRFS